MSELLGIVRFKFHEGKVEELKRLSARAMEIVRAQDTGTLQYDMCGGQVARFRDWLLARGRAAPCESRATDVSSVRLAERART